MPHALNRAAPAERPSAASLDSEIGRRIRLLREARRMSLAEIAERIGKSVGFISQVERGLSSPAVRELVQIAEVLGVDFLTLVAAPAGAEQISPVRRAGSTAAALFHPSGITKLPLSPANAGVIRLFLMTLEVGASTGPDLYAHEGEEAGLVMAGRIRLTIGTDVHELAEGDSFRFASHLPHGFGNAGTERATALWVNVAR